LLIYSWFDKICKNIYNFSFLKFKYKGKNYRWHRKKKGLVLRFGHSHLIYSKKPSTVFLKKKGRMKIIFFGTNVILIRLFLKNLIFWKPSNVYTGRGLRISRQRLLRKSGKVSAYR
jgi:ribosomal protein L6P/L9E